jgi:3-oxoacyl-[acyl-carrier-protein] synthase-3
VVELRVKVVGTGLFAPPDVETAEDLAKKLGRTAEWIESRTGVARRHISSRPMDQMAAEAARVAIGDGAPPDLIINASVTPIQLIPDSSVFIERALGWEGIPAFSVHSTCLSFMVAFQLAAHLLHVGTNRRILLVSAEQGSGWRDLEDPESAALIGDGAAAVVLERTPEGEPSALLEHEMTTWPVGAELAEFRGGGTRRPPMGVDTTRKDNLFRMRGPPIYKLAYVRLARMLRPLLARQGLAPETTPLVVPHQMSGPGLEAFVKYGFRRESVVNVVGEYGNCIAASMPMALAAADARGQLKRGDLVLLAGTGAGVSVAASLLRW